MSDWPELRTDRLLMRGWLPQDRIALAAINASRRVMEFIGDPMTGDQTDAFVDRIEAKFLAQGFGFWAVEVPGVAPFIGFVGLNVPNFDAQFMPAVEVGWRLGADFWGRGYASEAARAALAFGFDVAGLDEIVAFTSERNMRSRRVMERIGMTRDPSDEFGHPFVPLDDPLRPHVLYRASRPVATMRNKRVEGPRERCPDVSAGAPRNVSSMGQQERTGVGPFGIRELSAPDVPAVSPLLDAALGIGFWNPGDLGCEVALVAEADGAPIGVGTAGLDRTDDGMVGHIRLVAVDPAWRRRGVATALVRELVTRCEALDARSHLTYAWVHGADGTAPMAGVLVEAGFCLSRRIEGFYSGIAGALCPACGQSPCACPADLYLREATSARR